MRDPLVTTVIATYRRPAFLRRAILSALNQSLEAVRVMVCDNNSGDATDSVVRALMSADDRVTYHRHDTNIGAAANYNYGLSRVTTPYFSLLGDDDVLLPGLYEEAVAALERHPEAQFFCARTVLDNRRIDALQHRGSWPAGLYAPSVETVRRMVSEHFICTAVVFRRSVLDTVGCLDHLGSDRNFLVLASARHPFVASSSEHGVMTVHERSFSGGGEATDFGSGMTYSWGGRYVLESHDELVRRLSELPRPEGERRMLIAVLRRQTRRELIYVIVSASDHARAAASLRDTRSASASLGFGAGTRVLLALLDGSAALARVTHFAASRVWRITRRARAGRESDLLIRRYLAKLDSGRDNSADVREFRE